MTDPQCIVAAEEAVADLMHTDGLLAGLAMDQMEQSGGNG